MEFSKTNFLFQTDLARKIDRSYQEEDNLFYQVKVRKEK